MHEFEWYHPRNQPPSDHGDDDMSGLDGDSTAGELAATINSLSVDIRNLKRAVDELKDGRVFNMAAELVTLKTEVRMLKAVTYTACSLAAGQAVLIIAGLSKWGLTRLAGMIVPGQGLSPF